MVFKTKTLTETRKSRRPTNTDKKLVTGATMKQDYKNSENKEGDVFCS